ncbi:MAG: DUF5662 family protein [Rickettsiales bacterium]|jgi:hypothetical protein|nr:DUF5662 family protein [Rickettsiales bacterium]
MNSPIHITDDEAARFRARTAAHIASVNYFANLIGLSFPDHDASKFKEPEHDAYVVYSRRFGDNPIPPTEAEAAAARAAKRHHWTTNPHHAQFYADVSEMPEIRMIEMACDLSAVNKEANMKRYGGKGDEYSSATDYLERVSFRDFAFTIVQADFLRMTAARLERLFRAADFAKIWRGQR